MDNHNKNRKKVCILCLSKRKDLRPISDAVKSVIREKILRDVDARNWYYPVSICTSCRLFCTSRRKTAVSLYSYKYDYKNITRSNDKCDCEICKATETVVGKNFPNVVPRKVAGRPKKEDTNAAKVVRLCNLCLTEIKPGKKHACNATNRAENITKILKNDASSKAAEAAVSKFLSEKAEASGKELNKLIEPFSAPIIFCI